MILIENLSDISSPVSNAVITIGNFDGVHKGHQALIRKTIEKAKEIDGASVVITFNPHPKKVFSKTTPPPLITIYEQKIELIKKLGVDYLITIPFTKEFASLSANEFIEDILIKKIGMKAIIIGKDYNFGKKREGNIELLQKRSDELGFELIIPQWITTSKNDSNRISSTRVREMVSRGEVDRAPLFLGRYYQIRGKVINGRDRGGKLLGFPTANIVLKDELSPAIGVYAVKVACEDEIYDGVANIGYSPTFDDHMFTIEVHLLNFNKNIYDKEIKVNLISKLRDEKKFSGIEELSRQINYDIGKAVQILKNV